MTIWSAGATVAALDRKTLFLVTLASAAVTGGSLVAVGVLQSGGPSSKPAVRTVSAPSLAGVAEAQSLFAGIPESGAVLGAPNAPVTLVEYADPQCRYCAQWALNALPVIVVDYVRSGKVRLEFRPLALVGPESKAGVTALLALSMRGKMWEATHLLYANQGPENSGWINDYLVGAVVSNLGLGWPQFEYDRYSAKVNRAMARAERAAFADRITGTPAFFAGRTGGRLQPVQITSLDAAALRPVLDQLLGEWPTGASASSRQPRLLREPGLPG
jgi:protein-disulfide isomerase